MPLGKKQNLVNICKKEKLEWIKFYKNRFGAGWEITNGEWQNLVNIKKIFGVALILYKTVSALDWECPLESKQNQIYICKSENLECLDFIKIVSALNGALPLRRRQNEINICETKKKE